MSKKWKNKFNDIGSELEAYEKGELEIESTSPAPKEPQQEEPHEMLVYNIEDLYSNSTKEELSEFDDILDAAATPATVIEPVQEDNKTFKNEPMLDELEKKAELLTKEEKELLQQINAFSGYRLLWILKRDAEFDGMEQIRLRLSSTDKTKQYSVSLPMFSTGSKFANLEAGKMYMLSELGV